VNGVPVPGRRLSERAFHTEKWEKRSRQLSDAELLRGDRWDPLRDPNLRPMVERIPERPALLLELGCGPGLATLAAATLGHTIVYSDISEAAVLLARRRLRVNRSEDRARAAAAAGECLPFVGDQFDFVYGVGVLHHLALSAAASEIRRVLKQGASAVFVEPLGENPVLNLLRGCLREHTPDERMLSYTDLDRFGAQFSSVQLFESQLLSMIRLLGAPRVISDPLGAVDSWLTARSSVARRMCRVVTIVVTK